MSANYVLLCGAMWRQYGNPDAGWELLRALRSSDPAIVALAAAFFED